MSASTPSGKLKSLQAALQAFSKGKDKPDGKYLFSVSLLVFRFGFACLFAQLGCVLSRTLKLGVDAP